MKLTDLVLLSLQTAYMQRDLTTEGMCRATEAELHNSAISTYNVLMYQSLNTLEDTEFGNSLVDELAWQFHVDYYDPTADFDIKRNLVKKSIQIHRKKGTPQAVVDLLDTAFPSGITTVLNEWWEYGGEPYHFKITTSSLNGVNASLFYKALNSVKNARSYLDGVYFFTEILYGAISRMKVNREIEYMVDVADFMSFGFQDGKALAFSVKEYSFIKAVDS